MIKSKTELLKYLDSFVNYEIHRDMPYTKTKLNFFFMNIFLDKLNHPESRFEIIHIAGTNGKGSVAYTLSHLLTLNNYRTGVFTSPHLIEINERILLNHKTINDKQFIDIANKVKTISKSIDIKPSYFDMITAIAILFFAESKCEYVILETGLGGRLDSTNFSEEKLSIINTIAEDHINILGNNLNDIAKEKGGIIKPHNNVLIGKQNKTLYPLFTEIAKKNNSTLYQYGRNFSVNNIKIKENGISFDYLPDNNESSSIFLPLLSIYQPLNAALAIKGLELLGIKSSIEKLNQNLRSLILPARTEKVSNSPLVIIDGAHNFHAIKALKLNLKLRFKNARKKRLIFGMSKDKDYPAILPYFLPFFDEIYICKLSVLVKSDISINIYELAKNIHRKVYYHKSFQDAIQNINNRQNEDLLVITGSYYLCGEAKKYFSQSDAPKR